MIGRAKEVAVLESCKIARVAYLGQKTNIRSGHARKLQKDLFREGRDISVHDKLLEKGCRLRITRIAYLGEITNIESGRVRKL